MKINWNVRLKNPLFIVQVLASIFLPILAYFGLKWEDMTSWGAMLHVMYAAVQNPVVFLPALLGVFNAVIDPTTKGMWDSENAMAYVKPN
jgi:phi LC3 family holin